jgi:protein TonB
MFEQTIISEQRSPWALAISFTIQTAMAAGIVLLSIITIDRLPQVQLPLPMPPLPRAPRPVELVDTAPARTSASSLSPRIFTEPVRIPSSVAMVVDDLSQTGAVPVPGIEGIAGTGLPPGLYSGTPLYRTNPIERIAPPPPPAEQPAVSKPPKTITLGGNVMEAKIIRRVMPEYPRLAREMRISGTVKLVGIISRDGTVRELKVIQGHPLLVKSAVAAVMQWLYSPTLLNGEPVDVIAPIDVNFTLR